MDHDTSYPTPNEPNPSNEVYEFQIHIAQQPVRARMCGLGDKDRRQISPPPFVKLIVQDPKTKENVDVDSIDISNLVMVVELWDENAGKDLTLNQNLTVDVDSFGELIETSSSSLDDEDESVEKKEVWVPRIENENTNENQHAESSHWDDSTRKAFEKTDSSAKQVEKIHGSDESFKSTIDGSRVDFRGIDGTAKSVKKRAEKLAEEDETHLDPAKDDTPASLPFERGERSTSDSDDSLGDIPTRNLIGNVVTNGFKLYDENNEKGIWFIWYDLSVRIEGEFRLRFQLVDLSKSEKPNKDDDLNDEHSSDDVDAGKKDSNNEVLTSKYTDVFKVYSAKKFPGVVDSSPLGRVFASQGVKIPIRRENKLT